MGIYNATSALLNQLPNGQQPTAQHQLQQQGKQQNGDFDNFPTREDYRNGFTCDTFQVDFSIFRRFHSYLGLIRYFSFITRVSKRFLESFGLRVVGCVQKFQTRISSFFIYI